MRWFNQWGRTALGKADVYIFVRCMILLLVAKVVELVSMTTIFSGCLLVLSVAIAILFDLTAAALAFFVLRRMKVPAHVEAPSEMVGQPALAAGARGP